MCVHVQVCVAIVDLLGVMHAVFHKYVSWPVPLQLRSGRAGMRQAAHGSCIRRRQARRRPARASYKLLAPPCVRKARVRGWPRTSFCGTQLTICTRHSACRLQHRRQCGDQAGRFLLCACHSCLREAACPGRRAAPAGLCPGDAKAQCTVSQAALPYSSPGALIHAHRRAT